MPFASLLAALDEIQDPRRPQGRRYTLTHLLLFSVLAVLAGASSYQSIITFMSVHRERLNAIFGARFRRAPAVNTLRNLFLALNPADLEAAFRGHARQLAGRNGWRTVALDGKTLRGSFDHLHDQAAVHVLSAFASDAALILAHQEVEGAPEEVPAVPDLIAELGLTGVLFTADALHCQKGASLVRPRQAMLCSCVSRQTSQVCTMRWPRSVPNTRRSSGMRRWTAITMAARSTVSSRSLRLTATSARIGSRWSAVHRASLA